MMTVVAFLTQQYCNVLNYLAAACEAALQGETAPSLIPTARRRQKAHPARRLAHSTGVNGYLSFYDRNRVL
jgi:hypothetical protein